jgi:hypothetical protein
LQGKAGVLARAGYSTINQQTLISGNPWAEIHQGLLSQFSLLAEFVIAKVPKTKITEF